LTQAKASAVKLNNHLYTKYFQNKFIFYFKGIHLGNTGNILYQTKLLGLDDDWSPPNTEQQVSYNNLAPGTYTFLVKACNKDSICMAKPLQYIFTINAAWWQSIWFKIIGMLVLASIFYALYKYRIAAVKKNANAINRELQLEKELTALEQKALQLQMNPHFLFNALNSIQSLIGSGQDDKARYYLAKFSKLMRQILNNSQQNVITIADEVATLQNYLLVEQFTNSIKFEYNISVSPNTEHLPIPSMLVQPFVENCIKHGLRNVSDRQGIINVSFSYAAPILTIAILDNGIGMQQAQAFNSTQVLKHQSSSINISGKRLSLLHKNNSIKYVALQPGTAVYITIYI
jgi:sensor histidine kinase YesM